MEYSSCILANIANNSTGLSIVFKGYSNYSVGFVHTDFANYLYSQDKDNVYAASGEYVGYVVKE